MAEDEMKSDENRPSPAALARAGELLYKALERLAIEDAERAERGDS